MLRRHGVAGDHASASTARAPARTGRRPSSRPILDGEVDLIFNTPHGLSPDGRPRFDGYEIRTAGVLRNVPCITTVQGLAAAVQGIEAVMAGRRRRPLAAVLGARTADPAG